MKLTKTATKLKPGMTLIEITVVILVLLTLIAVLFIGANIYKKGADRAACILNIRNVHQAVRANQNLKGKNVGDALVLADDIYSSATVERYLTEPTCPTGPVASAVYTPAGTVYPDVGTAAVSCALYALEANGDHGPDDTAGW